jgi:translocation protein SEC66
MNFFSLLIPISYLSILVASMGTFSYLYRRRQHTSKMRLAPYFPPHTARNVYLSLLHLPENEKSTKVPESVLRAALLSRAMTDIHRIMEIRTRKPALSTLLQRGVVGDEIYQRLIRAEQELEVELKDVVAEANALAPGWGQSIFQSAGEMVQNQLLREKLEKVKESIPAEKQVWEQTREAARRELEGETTEATKSLPTPPPEPAPLTAAKVAGRPATAGSSDEDAVLVETPGTGDNATTGGAGGVGGKKKKKNKK